MDFGCVLANHGANIRMCLAAPDRLGEVPLFQLKVFRNTAGTVGESGKHAFDGIDLIVDALIGYSLRGAPEGITIDLIQRANESGVPILSLDVPSGIESTTGEVPGVAMQPTRTMTLALPKTGLSSTTVGDVILADINIPVEVSRRMGFEYENPFDARYQVPISKVPMDFPP